MAGYAARAPAAVLDRVPLFEAFTYLRLACKRFRLAGRNAAGEVAALLAAADRCLGGAATDVPA